MILGESASYLFDTTVFIDALRKRPIALSILQQARDKALVVGYSLLTEAELWSGITNSRPEIVHEQLLQGFVASPLTREIARRAGELHRLLGDQRGLSVPGLVDCLIAATAEQHHLRVCTRNTRHFHRFAAFGIDSDSYIL